MEVTLHLKPEVEARLVRQAQAQGMTIEQLLEQMIERSAASNESETPANQSSTMEEWREAFYDWVNHHDATKPPLSDEAISRESIYREREDRQL